MKFVLDKEKKRNKKLQREIEMLKQQQKQYSQPSIATSSSNTAVSGDNILSISTNGDDDDVNNDINYDTECGTEDSADDSSEDGSNHDDINYDTPSESEDVHNDLNYDDELTLKHEKVGLVDIGTLRNNILNALMTGAIDETEKKENRNWHIHLADVSGEIENLLPWFIEKGTALYVYYHATKDDVKLQHEKIENETKKLKERFLKEKLLKEKSKKKERGKND
ncbi:hypothetical protein K501DRAFT_307059 [Backusella circina FSU 941]|nr:hypothetical protein K501DRAFT_307059 [Backusella circina FSU 941]